MKKYSLITCLVLWTFNYALAQQFTHIQSIEQPIKDGMHQLSLTPEVRAVATYDFHDLRLRDDRNREVPFSLIRVPETTHTIAIEEYEYERSANSKSSTFLVSFKDHKAVSQLMIQVSNTNISKSFALSGSYNKKEWYAILQDELLSDLASSNETFVTKVIHFPATTYPYLRIIFNDSVSAPVNVLKIGKYRDDLSMHANNTVPGIAYRIYPDSIKQKTMIAFYSPVKQVLNGIEFTVSAPAKFVRDAEIYELKKELHKRRQLLHKLSIASLQLHSEKPLLFDLGELYADTFYMEINNADNPPLTINNIVFKQNQLSLVAQLNTGLAYNLVLGDKQLPLPNYDIGNFIGKEPWLFPKLKTGPVYKLPVKEASAELQPVSFWQKSWFMWACIGVVIVVIFVFSIGLLKDVNKNQS